MLFEMICVIAVIAYLISRTRYFREALYGHFTFTTYAVLIVIFGSISIFGTYSGKEVFGSIANVRDLGPMIGGLIGGPLTGFGAGLIGGMHRYLLGGFTAIPCSLATMLAGLVGGIIHLLNKGKFIGVFGAVLFAALFEVFHMIFTLLIAQPYEQAIMVVQEVSVPMIFSNSLGMLIFSFITSNLMKEYVTIDERDRYFNELEIKRYELKIANEIQQSFLPKRLPHLKGFDLAAITIPAKEVGGDFYDYIPISDDKVGLAVADVSGKSIPAALFMALSRTTVRANATRSPQVAEVIFDANRVITSDSTQGMFVTLFYGVLDITKRTLAYVIAGHHPPLMIKKSSEVIKLGGKGIALGVLNDIDLEERMVALESGDTVVFYTDGVIEAVDGNDRQFGEERFLTVLRDNLTLSADELIQTVKREISSFCGDTLQFDDITLMILKTK